MTELLVGVPVTALVAWLVAIYITKFEPWLDSWLPEQSATTVEEAVAQIDGHMANNEGVAHE